MSENERKSRETARVQHERARRSSIAQLLHGRAEGEEFALTFDEDDPTSVGWLDAWKIVATCIVTAHVGDRFMALRKKLRS
jgi:hypothetical protein